MTQQKESSLETFRVLGGLGWSGQVTWVSSLSLQKHQTAHMATHLMHMKYVQTNGEARVPPNFTIQEQSLIYRFFLSQYVRDQSVGMHISVTTVTKLMRILARKHGQESPLLGLLSLPVLLLFAARYCAELTAICLS